MSSGLSLGAETLAGSGGWIFALGRKRVGAGNDLDRCPFRWRCVSRAMVRTEDGRLWLGWMVVVVFTVRLDDREGRCRY